MLGGTASEGPVPENLYPTGAGPGVLGEVVLAQPRTGEGGLD